MDRSIVLSLLGLLLAGCIHLPGNVQDALRCNPGAENHYGGARACATGAGHARVEHMPKRRGPLSTQDVPFATGQIIVIERPGGVSLFLSLMAGRFAPYIHAGVIVIDDGKPYVYESFGFLTPRLSGSPTDGMGGGVRRVTLHSFLQRDGIIAVYDPPPQVERAAMATFARRHLAQHTPFDGYFDSRDAERLYCAEFVARALMNSGGEWLAGSPLSDNRSVRVTSRWLKTADGALLLAGDLVANAHQAWIGSRRYSAAQVDAYFALKQELHRRFTANQKLGNLLHWKLQSIHLRPAVQAYFIAGMTDGAPDPQALAAQIFGSTAGHATLAPDIRPAP
jgi:hypothetical protein